MDKWWIKGTIICTTSSKKHHQFIYSIEPPPENKHPTKQTTFSTKPSTGYPPLIHTPMQPINPLVKRFIGKGKLSYPQNSLRLLLQYNIYFIKKDNCTLHTLKHLSSFATQKALCYSCKRFFQISQFYDFQGIE